jgi:hypothetical protein
VKLPNKVRRTTQMSSTFWKSLLVSPAGFLATLLLSTGVMAAPKTAAKDLQMLANERNAIESAETTIANDVVSPGDWQYTKLQEIATKYGCNPNLNDKPVSKIDFARGLNACLTRVEPLLVQNPTPPAPGAMPGSTVTQEDLEVLKRLTQEFRAQLTEIDARIAQADQKLEDFKAKQFSTTTKLKGEAIFNLSGTLSGGNPNNTVFGNRARLLLESSFTGQDKLWTRLNMGNLASLGGTLTNPTPEGTQVADTGGNNSTGLDWLAYQFPWQNTNVYLAAFNGIHVDYAPSYAPYFEDFTGGSGALSSFAESSPIYKIGGGAGVGTTLPLGDSGITGLTIGYFSSSANSPASGAGLFGGDHAILAQANFKFSDQLEGGLTYVNSYHTGTNQIFAFGAPGAITGTTPANQNLTGASANSYGVSLAYKASDKLSLNGFVMNTKAEKGGALGSQDIWSYGGGIALPDVDGKGNLAGLFVGAEPYVGGVGSTPLHIEGFYKYKLNDNISITPGLIYLTAPNQINGNAGVIGTLRTTFLF